MEISKTNFLKAVNEIINKGDYRIELYRDNINIGTLMNLETNIFNTSKKKVIEQIFEINYSYYFKCSKKIKTIQLWVEYDNITCFYEFDKFEICSNY